MEMRFRGCSGAVVLAAIGCSSSAADHHTSPGSALFDFTATQIVEAATPDSIDKQPGTNPQALTAETLMSVFQDEVYLAPAGFTMPAMLKTFDDRLAGVNASPVSGTPDCLATPAAPNTIVTPDGSSFAFYAQCHSTFGDGTGFMVFGQSPEQAWTIYERGPALISVLSATETTPGTGTYDLDAYFSMGGTDPAMSAVAVHVHANSADKTARWTGAYNARVCGVSFYADSTKIHLIGSEFEPGTATTSCAAEFSAVYDAATLLADSSTAFDASKPFSGAQFLRRNAGSVSVDGGTALTLDGYPGGGNVTLTRGATSAADPADLDFGPDTIDELGSAPFVIDGGPSS